MKSFGISAADIARKSNNDNSLSKLTVEKLAERCAELDIDVSPFKRKADYIKAIEEKCKAE